MKIKKFHSAKYTVQNVKGQVTEWEKIFANCISNIHQECTSYSLNSTFKKKKKKEAVQLVNRQKCMNRYFNEKDVEMAN